MNEEMKIIGFFCGDIQERIKACRSREIAELLKNRVCDELAEMCKSDVIRLVLLHQVSKLIDQTFDSSGKNIYLEETHNVQ